MRYEDFLVLVDKACVENPKSRYGQVWFITLQTYRPELAYQLMGTELDPFYRDCVPGQTETIVRNKW